MKDIFIKKKKHSTESRSSRSSGISKGLSSLKIDTETQTESLDDAKSAKASFLEKYAPNYKNRRDSQISPTDIGLEDTQDEISQLPGVDRNQRFGKSPNTNGENSGAGDNQTYRSFQYSYNSNTNSLFSSRKTMSTSSSTQPSESRYSYKKGLRQVTNYEQNPVVGSFGLPLRVVHEEELENEEPVTSESKKSRSSSRQYRRPSIHSEDERKSFDISSFYRGHIEKVAHSTQAAPVTVPTVEEYEDKLLEEFILRKLKLLSLAVSNIMIQVVQSVVNLTKASISISECITRTTDTIANSDLLVHLKPYQFSTSSSAGLRRLIKYVLMLVDNLLVDKAYDSSKSLVLKSLYKLFVKLKLVECSNADINGIQSYESLMAPEFFPIGLTVQNSSRQQEVDDIFTALMSKSRQKMFSDQEGSFVAPLLRGFVNENLSVITFAFGFPDPTKEHKDVIKYFSANSDDLHFLVLKDAIVSCSSKADETSQSTTQQSTIAHPVLKFKSPFRIMEEDVDYVPISMSLSCNNSLTLSGTLGGYVYPKIPKNCIDPKLLKYQGAIFGLTCAHVVLNETILSENNGDPYPFVSVPSPVLVNLYRNALNNERLKYDSKMPEYNAYDQAVKELDRRFPVQEVKIRNRMIKRNLPAKRFGQIVWGERIVKSEKLSDMAIIKINVENKKQYLNFLGEDLNLSSLDPSLILSNLYIKDVVSLYHAKGGLLNRANLNVFKVGATTNFTTGKLNGMKMIYWSDGLLKTGEFVISSSRRKNFACGGDSGSFILSKLSDINTNSVERTQREIQPDTVYPPESSRRSVLSSFIESFIPSASVHHEDSHPSEKDAEAPKSPPTGLGLVGMLHSYDGELKQFGLFTPMTSIQERLHEVTGLEWGVVGCEDDELAIDEEIEGSAVNEQSSSDSVD